MVSRKGQFAALVVLVALGITSYVAFVSSYRNLTVSADHANNELKLADFTVHVVGAPASVADELAALPGVDAVEGRLVTDTGMILEGGDLGLARVISIPAGRHPAVNDVLVQEGAYPQSGSAGALINSKFAADAGKEPGSQLTLFVNGRPHKIGVDGVVAASEYLYPIRAKGEIPTPSKFAIVYMPGEAAGEMFGRPGVYNDFALLVAEGADREEVIGLVESALSPYHIEQTVRQEDIPSNFALQEEIRQNQSYAYFMPLVILVISALSLFITLSRLVQSQRGEIGLAKALGYTNRQVLVHYLLFSVFIAGAGSLIGFGLGELGGYWFTSLYTDLLGIPFLSHQVYPGVVLGAVFFSGATCLAAGLLPAWASARLPPVRAMHADPNLVVSGGKMPLVERLLGRLLPSAFTFRIPLRNVFRARRRSIYTIIGIIFALVLTISTWAMFDSVDYLLDRQFNQIDRWDISASFEGGFDEALVSEVSGWPGVSQAQPSLQLPVRLEAGGQTKEVVVNTVEPDADWHGFSITEGPTAEEALASGGIIITPRFAEALGVQVGDEIVVRSPYVPEDRLRLAAISDESWGAPVFTSTDVGRRLTAGAGPTFNTLYLFTSDSGASGDLKRRLYTLPGVAGVVVKQEILDLIYSMFDFIYLFGAILLGFGFTMAFVVIYNTFTANIMERTREIATMRTIGEDRTHLAIMVTLENLLLAVAGIPLGILAGLWLTQQLFDSLSTEAYSLKAVIYPTSYVWIILSIIGVLLVSEIPPIRRIFRLDLAEATKVME